MARVGEDEDLASPQWRKSRREHGARRLHLDLLRNKRLEWLVALRLMVLDRSPSERRALAADGAWTKFSRVRVLRLFVVDGLCSSCADVDLPVARADPLRVQSPGDQVVLSGLGMLDEDRRFQEEVERGDLLDEPRKRPKRAARLRPEKVRVVDVVRVRARVGRSAVPTREQLQHTRTAFARVTRLAVELARRTSALGGRKAGAVRVHAHPKTREASVERMDPTRQQSGLRRLPSRNAAERDEVRDRSRRDVGWNARIEQLDAQLIDGLRLLHRRVDEVRHRPERLECLVEGGLQITWRREVPILEEALDDLEAIRVGRRVVKVVEIERVQRCCVGVRPLRSARALQEVTLDLPKVVGFLARELRAELNGVVRILEGGARADDLQSRWGNTEPRAQASNQQGHLSALSASIEVRLVDDEEKTFVGVLVQPFPCAIEDGPLERTHQHVLEHRVVGDDHVGRRRVDLVPGDKLRVSWQCNAALEVSILVSPPLSIPAVPRGEIGLRRPLATLLQLVHQAFCRLLRG